MLPPAARSEEPEGHEPWYEGPNLRAIARTLTTPALSGLFLSRDPLAAIAARHSLPISFADRSQMLANMLRAAADPDHLASVLGALLGEVDRWEQVYTEWKREYPASGAIWDEWRTRLAQTR